MKTKSLFIALLFGAAISTTACKKCQTCEISGSEQEICRDDYGSQQLYDLAVSSLEAQGYECN